MFSYNFDTMFLFYKILDFDPHFKNKMVIFFVNQNIISLIYNLYFKYVSYVDNLSINLFDF